jgi:hypothetical protein
MALRLYLSPTEQAGGFAGIPRQTQAFGSTFGPPSANGNIYDIGGIWEDAQIVGAGRMLPCFPITTTKPTSAATIITWNIATTLKNYPSGTTYHMVATPVALGMTRITADTTVNSDDFIPPAATTGQWSVEFWSDNDLGGAIRYYGQIQPNVCYIWRPSTAALVGFVWCGMSENGAAEYARWGQNQGYWYDTTGYPSTYIYTGSMTSFGRGSAGVNSKQINDAYRGSVNALADDVIVFEFWHLANRAGVTPLTGNMYGRMAIGGGTDVTLITSKAAVTTEATPIHNTFVDLPGLSDVTFPTAAILPAGGANLVDVSPGTGPHLSLTFDGPVGITGPTIGAAADGLGVTGATQISATQIDLACAIRPDHPDGDAETATLAPPIGEADNLGPPIPTGIGAIII